MIRRFVRHSALLFGCSITLVGCGDRDDSTGPRAVSREVAAQELVEMSRDTANFSALQAAVALVALENGAEVRSVAVTVDGRAANFSMLGLAMVVSDTLDDYFNPDAPGQIYTDTLLLSFGWRGTPGSEVVTVMTTTDNAPFESLVYPGAVMSRVAPGGGSRRARMRERLAGARLLRGSPASALAAARGFSSSLLYYAAGEREYLGFEDALDASAASLTAVGGGCDRSLVVQRRSDDPLRPIPGTSFTCSNGRLAQQYSASLTSIDFSFNDQFAGGPPAGGTTIALRIASHSLDVPVLSDILDPFDDGVIDFRMLRGEPAHAR